MQALQDQGEANLPLDIRVNGQRFIGDTNLRDLSPELLPSWNLLHH